ncbi:MAG TPA: hypothetical protein VK569_09610 [Bacteroidota bacterium]|nr:hypothetical protein [Bacteroidota bacterium]
MRTYIRNSIPAASLHAMAAFLLLTGSVSTLEGQTKGGDQTQPLLFFPTRVPEKAYWQSAGLTTVAPPVEITEELQVRWPAFDYHALYGIPYGFALEGRAAVQVLQNRFSAGPKWSSEVGPVSYSLGWDLSYWFGALTVGGFDSKAHGWEGSPNVSLGYRFGDIAATVKVEALMDYSFVSSQGGLEVTTNSTWFTGMGYSVVLEQPFYKHQYLTLGLRAMYTKFFWQTWSLFPTFDRYLFYPEIIVGFIL